MLGLGGVILLVLRWLGLHLLRLRYRVTHPVLQRVLYRLALFLLFPLIPPMRLLITLLQLVLLSGQIILAVLTLQYLLKCTPVFV